MAWKSIIARGGCAAWLTWTLAASVQGQEPFAPPEVPPPVTAPAEAPDQQTAPCVEGGNAKAKSAGGTTNGASGSSAGRLADPREVRRERRKAWIFNRYAGSIEMQDKTPYPYGYYGDYYYRGWKPDWVYPLPPPPMRFEEPPVIRHPEGMPVLPGMEAPQDQPPVPAAKARVKTKRS